MSEVEKILQDLANGVDITLPQLTEEVIAFEMVQMDEVVVEEEKVD